MKIISIILDPYLANCIVGGAQKYKITISEFVRNLLHEKMQEGFIVINNKNRFKETNRYSQINRSEVGYIIFTAKLLEKLVLTTEEQGEVLHKLAFEETQVLLEQMKFNSKKQRFCISLEETLFTWLTSEATRLQLKLVPLIRKLLDGVFIQNEVHNSIETAPLSTVQKISIKYQIMTYKLLEKLINQTVDDAGSLIKEAQAKAEDLLLQLDPTKNKSLPLTSNLIN